jgi:hypothetical protein
MDGRPGKGLLDVNAPQLEAWLADHVDSWFMLAKHEYPALVDRWSALFWPMIAAGNVTHHGHRAIMVLESRLPCDIFLFNGVQIPQVMNLGGRGRAAYRAVGLCALDRKLANQLELIAAPVDLSWCCVFTHEAGGYGWEQLYEPGRHGEYSWQSEERVRHQARKW